MNSQIHLAMQSPGEHPLSLSGVVGNLEAMLTVPSDAHPNILLFLGHPHSLQGGSMTNKVVTTLARAAKEIGMASLRFNFRGVGHSQGEFDNGIGESEDLIKLVRQVEQDNPACEFIFAGFSFGSYVSYRAACQCPHRLLLSIAPPVERHNFLSFTPAPSPWEIIMGDADEVVPFSAVENFAKNHTPPIPMHRFADTGHFFHGQLVKLRQTLEPLFQRVLIQ
ncbi:alpha/beta hydrolase [Legionella sp. W05-934-2]|jgi:alpha/beta superfamily hydrolase|uniref:alpha/beta hydrolase n=1 Tax=Legionella sp. W05-934-2 TaxID=1198649 RepID=UPI003461D565